MEKLIKFLELHSINYCVIRSSTTGTDDIILLENSQSKELRQLKARIESRPSTLGLKVNGWKTNSYSVDRLSDSLPMQIVITEDNLISNYILKNSIVDNGVKVSSRVGNILFLAQVADTEQNVLNNLLISSDSEFNFAFYLSVQEVAIKIYEQEPEKYNQLPINITKAYLSYTNKK